MTALTPAKEMSVTEAWVYVPISQGNVAVLDFDDFCDLRDHNPHRWSTQQSAYTPYVKMHKENLLHRIIMRARPWELVDHKDHDGLNNRRSNLRLCDHYQNHQNTKMSGRGQHSKYKGAYRDKRRSVWCSSISSHGKQYWIGSFNTEVEAALAYDAKAVELFGEFAYLNFPKKESE